MKRVDWYDVAMVVIACGLAVSMVLGKIEKINAQHDACAYIGTE